MAFVKLNAKEATTVAIRTLSALHGKEKEEFQKYLKDLGKFLTSPSKSFKVLLGGRFSVINVF